MGRWVSRLAQLLACFAVAVAGYVVLSVASNTFPANSHWKPASVGVEVYLISNGVHVDIVVPVDNDVMRWSDMFPSSVFPAASRTGFVGFGWGDRTFFLETRTWADFEVSSAVSALFWKTSTVMHVTQYADPSRYASVRSLNLRPGEYERLVAYIDRSFQRNGLRGANTDPWGSYAESDMFYEAIGHYSLINTCNAWAGWALKEAGVRVATGPRSSST